MTHSLATTGLHRERDLLGAREARGESISRANFNERFYRAINSRIQIDILLSSIKNCPPV